MRRDSIRRSVKEILVQIL